MQLHELNWNHREESPDDMVCADVGRGHRYHLCKCYGFIHIYDRHARAPAYVWLDEITAQAVLYELLKE